MTEQYIRVSLKHRVSGIALERTLRVSPSLEQAETRAELRLSLAMKYPDYEITSVKAATLTVTIKEGRF